jgi:hypothetical protein
MWYRYRSDISLTRAVRLAERRRWAVAGRRERYGSREVIQQAVAPTRSDGGAVALLIGRRLGIRRLYKGIGPLTRVTSGETGRKTRLPRCPDQPDR